MYFDEEGQQGAAPDQSLRKTLNGMFSRYDYVGLSNPLQEPFKWAVALEQNEIVGMSQGDQMQEEAMAQKKSGTFLPSDGPVRSQQRLTTFELAKGERKMVPGEAAYVLIPRIYAKLIRERFGTDKAGLARLRNPNTQRELLKEILVGPVVNNIGQAVQTFVNEKMSKIEGFTDIQTKPPKGFSDPAVLEKARATREANKAAKSPAA